ncbi:MAG: hypothetical protein J6M30_01565 [Bacteroidales bacterium]|nr:hypothetical protein [Bacteroidales bacterium]
MGFINKVYYGIRNYLADHKKIALFFAHGGLHVVVLLILIVVGIGLYCKVQNINKYEYTPLVIEVGDTLRNYTVSQIYLELFLYDNEQQNTNIKISYEPINKNKSDLTTVIDSNHAISLVSKISCYSKNLMKSMKLSDTNFYYSKDIGAWNDTIHKITHITKSSVSGLQTLLTEIDGATITHPMQITSDNLLKRTNNPYYCFELRFKDADGYYTKDSMGMRSRLKERFCIDSYSSQIVIFYNAKRDAEMIDDVLDTPPLVFNKIIPTPSKITGDMIAFDGKEKVEEILNGGLYLEGVDLNLQQRAEKIQLLFTVLIGVIITFALDVFVNLILKWRKLNKKDAKSI